MVTVVLMRDKGVIAVTVGGLVIVPVRVARELSFIRAVGVGKLILLVNVTNL